MNKNKLIHTHRRYDRHPSISTYSRVLSLQNRESKIPWVSVSTGPTAVLLPQLQSSLQTCHPSVPKSNSSHAAAWTVPCPHCRIDWRVVGSDPFSYVLGGQYDNLNVNVNGNKIVCKRGNWSIYFVSLFGPQCRLIDRLEEHCKMLSLIQNFLYLL